MKIKGLLFGLFACAALAACTNEDIVDNNGNGEQEKVKANVTFVIGASTNSSRATTDEDSDTKVDGTTVENSVSNALIVLQNKETKKEYAFPLGSSDLQPTSAGTEIVYKPSIKVQEAGTYNAIVILNPCTAIKNAGETFASSSDGTLPAGASSLTDYIKTYEISGDITSGIAKANNFMMVNPEAKELTITSNQETTVQTENINVERVASKISYRPLKTGNLYEVTVNTEGYTVNEVDGWVIRGGVATHMTGMWCGTYNGEDIFVHTAAGDTQKFYESTGRKYLDTEELEYTEKMGVDISKIVWKTSKNAQSTEQSWYIKLTRYALVNLSNRVYAVRNIMGSDNKVTTFGLLDGSNYIVDPYTEAKNAKETNFTTYFFNVGTAVADDFDTYAKRLPDGTDEDNDETDNDEYGKCLSYCYENGVMADNQTTDYVTGIIFEGKFTKADGTELGATIYGYKKGNDEKETYYYNYEDICADNEIDMATAVAKASVYESGSCYYYSKDITHNENGNMKHAIMRNNIYSLQVNGFTAIGSATVEFPTQGDETDKNFYLKLTSKILPWKVRFNNITF